MARKLGFFGKIRNRFAISFALIVLVLTSVVVSMIGSSYKDLIDRFAKDSLESLSKSVFETLYVSMNYGDNAVVNKVLVDLKEKNLVDRLEIYRNIKIDELFEYESAPPIPLEIGALFASKKEQYIELKTENFNGVRFLKPILARDECISCHTNMSAGEVLGIVDLTLSLEKQMKQSEFLISKIVAWILVLVAISGVILHFVSKQLMFDPIKDLQKATKQLSVDRDLNARVAIRGLNEFGDIAHHFNRFIGFVQGINRQLALEEQRVKELLADREDEIRKRTAELKRYVEIVDENVITSKTDLKGVITYASEAFCEISGYTKEELLGKAHNFVRHPDMPKATFEQLWGTIKAGNVWSGEVKNLKKNGETYYVNTVISPVFDESGNIEEYIAIRHDVTLQKELEHTLAKLTEVTIKSQTDTLTGLSNRSRINEAINNEILRAGRYGTKFAVAIIDVDHFKAVNDTYGHLEGDFVLKEIAKIARNKTRSSDVVGRWGGEEFVIVFVETDIEQAKIKCERIRHWIELHDYGVVPRVTASFGLSGFECGDSLESLVARADKALYRAKTSGRNRIEIEKESLN